MFEFSRPQLGVRVGCPKCGEQREMLKDGTVTVIVESRGKLFDEDEAV